MRPQGLSAVLIFVGVAHLFRSARRVLSLVPFSALARCFLCLGPNVVLLVIPTFPSGQTSANYGLQATSSPLPHGRFHFFGMPIPLCIVDGCFHITVAEWNSGSEGHMPQKPKACGPFSGKVRYPTFKYQGRHHLRWVGDPLGAFIISVVSH